ncbi:MAG: ABC transporter substrate-binding protein, partial [Acidimicrobiia bacterium]
MRRYAALAAALASVLVLAACGDPLAVGGTFGGGTECPVDALDDADGTVEITFWHAMARENEATLNELVDGFNDSQDKVRVKAVYQGAYDDTLTKYRASTQGGARPDVVQVEDAAVQTMIDSGTVLPIQACIDADDYSLDDNLPRALAYYSVDRTLYALPFNISNPILYYNKLAFRDAGLDPNDPPATFAEVREASQQIVRNTNVGTGVAFLGDPWFFEQWLATSGDLYVDNDNGRAERADSVVYDSANGREVFEWLDSMVDDGLANFVGTDPSSVDHLLAIGNENAAMTINSTAALGTVSSLLESGSFPNVDLGVGPMPGFQDPEGGVTPGGAGLYIVNSDNDANLAATWEFLKYLNTPRAQAIWSAGTGYIPAGKKAAQQPIVQELWAEQPGFKVAYDQLLDGPTNFATAGALYGNFQAVRDSVAAGYERMLTSGTSPADALAQAAAAGTAAIQSYNDRIGAERAGAGRARGPPRSFPLTARSGNRTSDSPQGESAGHERAGDAEQRQRHGTGQGQRGATTRTGCT